MGLLAWLSGASAAKKQAAAYQQILQPYINQYQAEGDWGVAFGKDQLQQASSQLDYLTKYFRDILEGSQSETLKNIDAAGITESFDDAQKALTQDYVRGGLRASQTAALPFEKSSAVNKVVQELRTLAPQQLAQLAQLVQSQGALGLQYGQSNRDNVVNIMNMIQQVRDKARDRASALTGSLISAGASVIGGWLAGR